MPGVTGREVAAAFARSSTWSTAASVTRGILLATDEGIEDHPMIVDDLAFGQTFVGEGEVSRREPPTPDLQAQCRYEQLDSWLAAGCGSAAAPVAVSSQGAANSLAAYSHVITLAPELLFYYTLAIDTTQYVKEFRTFKLRGWSIKIGDGGVLVATFPTVGDRVVYNSTVNTNSTVWGAAAATVANRVFMKDGRFRMNLQTAGSLGATDCSSLITDFEITNTRPLAQDHVVGSDVITEADDDGFADFGVKLTFARMNTVTANSLVIAMGNGQSFKMDFLFSGAFINSATQRSLLIEIPAAQVQGDNFKAAITGANQARPTVEFKLKRAQTAPSGMAFTSPLRVTIVNMNSQNLLT